MEDRLAGKIRDLRRKNNYSEAYVSEMMNMPLDDYFDVEDGRKELTVRELQRLCSFYNISLDSLLSDGSGSKDSKMDDIFNSVYEGQNEEVEIYNYEPRRRSYGLDDSVDVVIDKRKGNRKAVFELDIDRLLEKFDEEDDRTISMVESEDDMSWIPDTNSGSRYERRGYYREEAPSFKKGDHDGYEEEAQRDYSRFEPDFADNAEDDEEVNDSGHIDQPKASKQKKKSKKGSNFLLFLVVIILLADAGLLVMYKYQPERLALYVDQAKERYSEVSASAKQFYETTMQWIADKKAAREQAAEEELWSTNKAINKDYVGQLTFTSGLINVPVVKGTTNEQYRSVDWATGEESEIGSTCMDAYNHPEDQNLVIYANSMEDCEDGFGPLSKLLESENYSDNKELTFTLENEVRTYVVSKVFYCEMIEENGTRFIDSGLQFLSTNYDEDYFLQYMENVNNIVIYQTDTDLTYEDRFMTLYTKIPGTDNMCEVVICKEVSEAEQ